jgi:hypothetical protein
MANTTKLFHTYIFVVLYDCVYAYVGRELYKKLWTKKLTQKHIL